MSLYSFAQFNYLVIVSLLINLVPLPHVDTATPRGLAETQLVVKAMPNWFSVRPDSEMTGVSKSVWLPAIRPVHSDLALDAVRRGSRHDAGDRGLWLWVDFYDDQLLSDWAFSTFDDFSSDVYHEGKLDFCLTCDRDDWPYYSDCKLHEDLNDGLDYSARWYGGLLVPETGSYTFWLEGGESDPWNSCGDNADDGARMFIDGDVVAEHDWNYGPKVPSNTVTLEAGLHYLAVDYQQRWIDQATLRVSWSGPGFDKEVIPALDADALLDDAGYGDECPLSNCGSSNNEEGGPVNTRTGNYLYRVRDLEMQTLAGPLSFERTYIAQATDVYANGLLGYGWAFNHDRRLIFYGDDGGEQGTVILRGKSGSSLRFSQSWENPLEFQAWPGIRAEMTAITGTVFCDQGAEEVVTSFVITAADQSRWTFAQRDGEYSCFTPPSLLSAYQDPQGNVLTYTYNLTYHWLSRVEDASGRYLAFDVGCLDASGDEFEGQCLSDKRRLLAVSDHSGRAVRFGYDLASGDLTVVTDTRGFAWTYAYSGTTHWLQDARDPYGRVIERNWYDRAGRVITQSDGLGQLITFDYAHHTGQTTVTFPLGQAQVDQYDARNVWTGQSREGEGSSYDYDENFNRRRYTDANGRSTQYDWSEDGYNPQSITDALSQTTRFIWNERHNLTGMVNAQGYTTTYEYDELNNPITTTDALGGMTVNRYDARGNLVQTTRNGAYTTTYAYDRFSQQIALTDTLGHVTRYQYDQLGRTVAVTTPQGITRHAYDAAGHTIAITRGYVLAKEDGRGTDTVIGERVTRYGFDALGRQTHVTETVPLPAGGVEQRVTCTWHDAVGQVVSVTRNYRPGHPQNFQNQYNLTTRYAYDAAGNQSTVTDTLGHVNRTFYDAWNRPLTTVVHYVDGTYDLARPDEDILTTHGYDAVGNPVTTTDTLGRVTVNRYDELNRVVTTTVNYTHTTPNPDPNTYNLVTTYGYDAMGNLVTTTNPLGRVTVNVYDALNRLVSATTNYTAATKEQNYQDQYNLVTAYSYDEAGNQVAVTDTLAHVTRYQYDNMGRQVTTTNALSGVAWVEYDALGRRWKSHACAELDDDGGCVTRHTTVYTYDVVGRLAATENAAGGVTRYSFDALGNTLVMTDAEGNTTRYAYDALNRLVTTTNALSGTTVVKYDALSRRVSELTNGQTTRYAYDGLGRTATVTDALGNVTRYAYDGLGNRVAVSDPLTHTTVYTYNSLNRLIATANAEGNVTRYTYDGLGQRTVLTNAEGMVTRYQYDAAGRLAAVVENYIGGAQTDERDTRTIYGYDALGNRTHITNALGHTSVYTYDALNRLVAEADPLGHTTIYTYNILGQRSFVQDADGMVVSYTYDAAGRVAATHYPTSGVSFDKAHDVQYAYDRVGNRTTMTDSLGTTTYTYDALYRLQAIKDPFGQIVYYTYDVAGNRNGLVYPDGKTVTYTHDALNRLTIIEDWDNGLTRYGYDGAGRLVTTTLPNGVQSRYGYDNANSLTLVEHRDAEGALLASYVYQLDQVGNRTLVTETLLTPNAGQLPFPERSGVGEMTLVTLPAGLSAEDVVETVMGGVPGLARESHAPRTTHHAALVITSDTTWYSDTVEIEDLSIANGAVLTLAGTSGTQLVVGDLIIASGASLVISGKATIAATNVTIEAGAFLSADGLGYSASDGPGAGADGVESLRQASGGGHGGWGGVGSDGYDTWDHPYDVYLPLVVRDGSRAGNRAIADNHAGGQPYDDASRPRMMGSGGGSAGSASGGAGGGALRLMVDDTLILNGALSANGLVGNSGDFHAGGGGAGGSLWIEAATFTGDGVLRADGGDSGGTSSDNAYGQGGGGAGGRVAIYASNNAFTSSGGAISVAGSSGHEDGEAGSVYISVTATSLVTVTADFAATPVSGNAPLTVMFTNLSASSDEVESYQWDFGDGSTPLITGGGTSVLENPTYVYTRSGSFTVILTTTVGSENDVEVKSDYISVIVPSQVTVTADFAATPTSGDVPLTVTFTNLSTSSDEVESYQWDFGDGSTLLTTGGETSALKNPTHVYTQIGNFTVSLTATTGSESASVPPYRDGATWGDTEVKADYIAVYVPSEPGLVTRTITYTYDGLYRLTGVDYSSGEEFGYAYDAVGNMMAITETISTTIVTTYTHNAAYQLVTARASNDGVTWHYTYDKRGNLVRQTPGSAAPVEGETRYIYDAAGNLARVDFYTAGDYSTLAEAAYNGAGERVRLTTWAAGVPVTVTFAVFDGQLLMSNDGIQDTLYLYGRRLIAEHGREWAYPLRDRDGSARQIADRSGLVSLARAYKPLGGILQEQGAYEGVFGYLGAQLDRISGLLYADGRYFDPTTGRFLTPNQRIDAYHPRSLNPYVPWVDPTLLLLGPLMVWATLAAGERRRRYGRWMWVLLLLWVAVSVVGCQKKKDEATPITSLTATVILSSPLIVPHATETLIETPTRTMTLTVTPTSPATPTATILATLTCTPTPPTPTDSPSDADVIATARTASLEAGGLGIWETDANRDQALTDLAWVVRNRIDTPGFNCNTAEECAGDEGQFHALLEDPDYEPTQHEQDIVRRVLVAPQNEDTTGNSVYFHDFSAASGPDSQLRRSNPNGGWGFYFYTSAQCPGGPRSNGVGCSFVSTPTPP